MTIMATNKKANQIDLSDDEIPQKGLKAQYAALPFRMNKSGQPEVLLITSRETKRWVIPKGWPMSNKLPCQTAQIEAYEEAGILGNVRFEPVGFYRYLKQRIKKPVWCRVAVFPMTVEQQCATWPEKDERIGRWFSLEEAAKAVHEPELADIIRSFRPGKTLDTASH